MSASRDNNGLKVTLMMGLVNSTAVNWFHIYVYIYMRYLMLDLGPLVFMKLCLCSVEVVCNCIECLIRHCCYDHSRISRVPRCIQHRDDI